MNRGINKVILIGYLGQDPEIHYMVSGSPVTKMSIATADSWKDKRTNEFKEKTEWHRVVLFGKLAEIASSYLHKGSQVYIEGALRTRKWKSQDGQDRYITEVIVGIGGIMHMLGNSRSTEDKIINSKENAILSVTNDENNNRDEKEISNESVVDFDEDDIPF